MQEGEKSMIAPGDIFEPAAIQFTLKCLQESAR